MFCRKRFSSGVGLHGFEIEIGWVWDWFGWFGLVCQFFLLVFRFFPLMVVVVWCCKEGCLGSVRDELVVRSGMGAGDLGGGFRTLSSIFLLESRVFFGGTLDL